MYKQDYLPASLSIDNIKIVPSARGGYVVQVPQGEDILIVGQAFKDTGGYCAAIRTRAGQKNLQGAATLKSLKEGIAAISQNL